MKSDFTRLTFDPARHYSRVLFQQGRLPLDADFNEQTEILLHQLRQTTADLIGPHGAPAITSNAFKFTTNKKGELKIESGRYYVNGIPVTSTEADFDDKKTAELAKRIEATCREKDSKVGKDTKDLNAVVMLRVWEHHRTWLDDGAMRDTALGGRDTAARSQVVWDLQVCQTKLPAARIRAAYRQLFDPPARGLLTARLSGPHQEDACHCTTGDAPRYRGAGNQLYRVEVHRGGPANEATFKWSRENGSVLARWEKPSDCDGSQTLRASGVHDRAHGFHAGDWVEITDERTELRREPGKLLHIKHVEGNLLTLHQDTPRPDWASYDHPKIRRWDQRASAETSLQDGAILIHESTRSWQTLENGIEIQFAPPDVEQPHHLYRTGDYWIFAARPGSGKLEWPTPLPNTVEAAAPESPRKMAPYGIEDHYAPLALINATFAVTDLRSVFNPLAQPL